MFRLLIVDGSSRMHSLCEPSTQDVVDRFFRELRRTVRLLGGPIPIVCWDHPDAREERRKYIPDYKMKGGVERSEVDPEKGEERKDLIKHAIAMCKDTCCCWFDPKYEADDLIASIVSAVPDWPIAIHSADHDMFSLLGGARIQIVNSTSDLSCIKYFTAESVEEKYGVSCEQWLDYRCLSGDSSDNVPGVASVGAKTAQKLLSEYYSVQLAVDTVDDSSPPIQKSRWKAIKTAFSSGRWEVLQKVLGLWDDAVLPPNVLEAMNQAKKLRFYGLDVTVDSVIEEMERTVPMF